MLIALNNGGLISFLDVGSALNFQIVILVISYFKYARQRQHRFRVGTRRPKHEVASSL